MGLDMYLRGSLSPAKKRTVGGKRLTAIEVELGYWRKHANLHGYIVNTFADGVDECQTIDLDDDALVDIMAAVKERRLPKTEGFFFGSSATDEAEIEAEIAEDLKILTEALAWMQDAKPKEWRSVTYRASW